MRMEVPPTAPSKAQAPPADPAAAGGGAAGANGPQKKGRFAIRDRPEDEPQGASNGGHNGANGGNGGLGMGAAGKREFSIAPGHAPPAGGTPSRQALKQDLGCAFRRMSTRASCY